MVPLVAVSVSEYVPAAADFVDVSVRVELPEVVIEAGAKLAVTPEGMPVADSATLPVKPFCAETLAVKVVEFPAVTDCELGLAENVKSGVSVTAFTLTLMLAL
jgi:hypothetical protein